MASHLNLSQSCRSRNSPSWDKRNSGEVVRSTPFLCENELAWNDINKSHATCAAVTRNPKTIKPIVDPSKFSTWNKLLLTVATVFNLIHRAKKMRTNNHQYTNEDIQLSRNYLLKLSQDSFLHSTGFGKSSNNFADQGQNFSFVLGTCPSNMSSPVHRTKKSIHSTTLPCDWPSENVSKRTISLFLISTLWHDNNSTN